MKSKFRSLDLLAPCLLTVAACGDTGTSPGHPQSRIEILPAGAESVDLGLADTVRLTARRLGANGAPLANDGVVNFLWQSSDTTVLVVDPSGLVELVGLGTATVSVRLAATSSPLVPHSRDTAVATLQLTGRPRVLHPGPVAAMAVTYPQHACVLLVDGSVECRGRNDSGQIGIGTVGNGFASSDVTTWSRVEGGHTFSTISTSFSHTCGMSTDGQPYCWGSNAWRNLDMDLDVRRMPVPVEFGEDYRWAAIHAGGDGRTCGITTGQVPMCAGRNGWGQTGQPVGVWESPLGEWGSGHRATAIKTDIVRTCALVAGGALYCSGRTFAATVGAVPVFVDSSNIVLETFDIGDAHGCGLTENGKAYCWGYNYAGQLGTGDLANSQSMRPVAGEHVFTSIDTENDWSCGLTTAGEVWCWGRNYKGTMGRTRLDSSPVPVRVPLAPGVKAMSLTTGGGACIIDASRRMSCWGGALATRWAGSSALAQDGGQGQTAMRAIPQQLPATLPPD